MSGAKMTDTLFSKYKKSNGKTRVLMLYLILNKYDLTKVTDAVEIAKDEQFGLELKKIYGETTQFVDVKSINAELEKIKVPVICSLQSYEIYSNSEKIYAYTPKISEKPLYINDMGIISPLMVITEDCIVSSNPASPLENSSCKGFMYFVDYILQGRCEIGKWIITYKNREFKISYCDKTKDGEDYEQLLYHAVELDLSSTFRLVLYIIGKVAEEMDEFPSDNYEEQLWTLKGRE